MRVRRPVRVGARVPGGTERYIIGIFPSIIAFLAGAGVFAMRGGRSTDPGLPPAGEATLSNPVPFGSARPAPPKPAPDPLERLEHLVQLKKSGVLTDAEFEAQKTLILGMRPPSQAPPAPATTNRR